MFRNSFFLPDAPVVKNLIIANVLVFIAQLLFASNGNLFFDHYFAEHHLMSSEFRPHQWLTAVFMHGSFSHLFSNMLALFFFGAKLEMVWGAKRFLRFYLICGIGASIISSGITLAMSYPLISQIDALLLNFNAAKFQALASAHPEYFTNVPFDAGQDMSPLLQEIRDYVTGGISLGASGAIFGILAAAAFLFPNDIVYINLFIPMKMKWMALLYGAFELYMALQNDPNDQVGHVAHLGGALVGFIIVYFGYRRRNKRFY